MNPKTFKRSLLGSAVIAASLGLSGCWLCDSDSNSTGSFAGASALGTATKGIIFNGLVSAQELNETGSVVRDLVTDIKTLEDGTYSLEIPKAYQGGAILLTLSLDANSKMKCDASAGCGSQSAAELDLNNDGIANFGEWYLPGTGAFQLSTLLPPVAAEEVITASITPFTTMAANFARTGSANLDAASVQEANAKVSALFNLDILTTAPLDITNPANLNGANYQQIAYAAMSAAIANLANENASDLGTEIGKLVSSYATNGSLTGQDIDASTTSLEDIINGMIAAIKAADINDILVNGAVNDLQDEANTAGNNPVNNAIPDTATLDNIGKAKALVAQLRELSKDNEAALNDPNFAQNFSSEIDAAALLLEQMQPEENPLSSIVYLTEVMAAGLTQLENDAQGNIDLAFTFSENDDFAFNSGTATFSATHDEANNTFAGTLTFSNAATAEQTTNLSIQITGKYHVESSQTVTRKEGEASFEITSATATGNIVTAQTELALNDTQLMLSSVLNAAETADDSMATNVTNLEANSGVTFTVNTSDTTTVSFVGDMTAELLSNYAQHNDSAQLQVLAKSLSFDGSVAVGEQMLALGFSFNLPNIEDFTQSVAQDETADHYVEVNGSMIFKTDLADLTDVTVMLEAFRSGLESGSTRMTLQQDGISLIFEGSATLTDNPADSIAEFYGIMLAGVDEQYSIADQNGTQFVLTASANDNEIAQILVNDKIVAVLKQADNNMIKISYANGEFEFL